MHPNKRRRKHRINKCHCNSGDFIRFLFFCIAPRGENWCLLQHRSYSNLAPSPTLPSEKKNLHKFYTLIYQQLYVMTNKTEFYLIRIYSSYLFAFPILRHIRSHLEPKGRNHFSYCWHSIQLSFITDYCGSPDGPQGFGTPPPPQESSFIRRFRFCVTPTHLNNLVIA